MVNLIDLLHQKIELFRLEQRYTRRRNRRSTFHSEAQYVDGEYIYTNNSSPSSYHSSKSPRATTTTYEAKCSGGSDSDEVSSPVESQDERARQSKGSKRLSRMGLDKMDWRKGKAGEAGVGNRVSVREVKWER